LIVETRATGPGDKGTVMPALLERLKAKADGREQLRHDDVDFAAVRA
jgi:hypothetical protein